MTVPRCGHVPMNNMCTRWMTIFEAPDRRNGHGPRRDELLVRRVFLRVLLAVSAHKLHEQLGVAQIHQDYLRAGAAQHRLVAAP